MLYILYIYIFKYVIHILFLYYVLPSFVNSTHTLDDDDDDADDDNDDALI